MGSKLRAGSVTRDLLISMFLRRSGHCAVLLTWLRNNDLIRLEVCGVQRGFELAQLFQRHVRLGKHLSPIDNNCLPRYERRFIAGQKERRIGDIFH